MHAEIKAIELAKMKTSTNEGLQLMTEVKTYTMKGVWWSQLQRVFAATDKNLPITSFRISMSIRSIKMIRERLVIV